MNTTVENQQTKENWLNHPIILRTAGLILKQGNTENFVKLQSRKVSNYMGLNIILVFYIFLFTVIAKKT